jgi:LAO/AO transport system kinase
MSRHAPTIAELAAGVRRADRARLGQALTLVESHARNDRLRAEELLIELMPSAGGSIRVGVTGAPGVGKSTFVDALGTLITARGRSVAVLAVDPTSARSGGSVLGDKTRMSRLSRDPRAFVRPSPSGGALGGVAHRTREAITVCEAAGFDVVIVETVGVGQSETEVAAMVDTFVLLWLPSSGDELQGIKRGIVELADIIVVSKADGERAAAAERAAADVEAALRYLAPTTPGWTSPVIVTSALEGRNVDAVWDAIERHRAALEARGVLGKRRAAQAVRGMWAAVERELVRRARQAPAVRTRAAELEREVEAGRLPPSIAAARLLDALAEVSGVPG